MRSSFFSFLFVLAAAAAAWAQSESGAAARDTLKQRAVRRSPGLEGPIEYEARIFDNFVSEKKTVLIGGAVVTYLDMRLKAEKITVDWETSLMTAEGIPDSMRAPAPSGGDSIWVQVLRGKPEFTEAGDVMTGDKMVYNFKTRKGRVVRGRTTFEDAYYSGSVMKMVGNSTAFIGDANFTTCDRDNEPHFHFEAKQMRVDIKKSVVARPLVMYIGKIPVLGLPFVYFPIKKGRRSGILLPRYGQSTLEGNYLKGFGYYWAASDYWDLQGTVDYYEKSGFLFRGDFNYNVRYKMRGSISGSWTRKDFESSGQKERRWDMVVRHNQELSPTMRLSASGTFVSSKDIYRQLSANRDQRMQAQIRSNATLTKQWSGSRSLTVNLSRVQDLKTDEYTETLPRVSFRGGRTALFSKPAARRGQTPAARWYHNIYLSYNSTLESRRESSLQIAGGDSTYVLDKDLGLEHTLSLNSPQKLFRWITVTPNLNYHEVWLGKRSNHYWNQDSLRTESDDETGFFARRLYDMSVSVGTKMYGIFRPGMFPGVLIRHVVTPSLGYTYQPDFSAASFEYYDTVRDTAGNVTYYDRYGNTMFSNTPRGGRRSINASVQNLFQMRSGEGEDAKKIDLFTWNVSSSYNWKAEQFKLGNIASSLRAKPFKNINLNISAIHSPYHVDADGKTVDRYYVSDIQLSKPASLFDSRWLRMVNFSADLRMSFRGTASTGKKTAEADSLSATDALSENPPVQDRFDMHDSAGGVNIPWQLTTSVRYSDSRYDPNNPNRQFWLNADLQFNLTKNWRISWTGRLDLLDRDMVSQDIVIQRDLHCWEARFVWTPIGLYKRFYLRINIKSSMLQDIKFERGTGRSSFSGSSFQSMYY
ncbi:LPS-assembly protein LptD [bacterium]|nr:LPS-assembly protein LptD [bacterium]